MASFYDFFMKPLESMGIRQARKILMSKAQGSVLEIGAGTGANIPFYDMTKVTQLVVTDQERSKHLKWVHEHIQFVQADATNLPFEDDHFDMVVHTLVFCSVSDVNKGLQEVKRVLKPNGTLIFIEHVLPHKKGMKRLFKGFNPIWRTFSQGCSLTKDFEQGLLENNFKTIKQGTFLNTVFYYGIAQSI